MKHRHAYHLLNPDGLGEFAKQEGQGDDSVFRCRGRIERCACGTMRMIPHDKRLKVVEVEA